MPKSATRAESLRRYWRKVKILRDAIDAPTKQARRVYRKSDVWRDALETAIKAKNPKRYLPLARFRAEVNRTKKRFNIPEKDAVEFVQIVGRASKGRVVKKYYFKRPDFILKDEWEKMTPVRSGDFKGAKIVYWDALLDRRLDKESYRARKKEIRIAQIAQGLVEGRTRKELRLIKDLIDPETWQKAKRGGLVKLSAKEALEVARKIHEKVIRNRGKKVFGRDIGNVWYELERDLAGS